MDFTLIAVTDDDGAEVTGVWLSRAEAMHRELRPQLAVDYGAALRRVFASGGRMVVAVSAETVIGLAVWRVSENTMFGRFLYIDDLVTDPTLRSKGVGAALLRWCHARAVQQGCRELVLDSGVQRSQAHRFYFREGLTIRAFNFGASLPLARIVHEGPSRDRGDGGPDGHPQG